MQAHLEVSGGHPVDPQRDEELEVPAEPLADDLTLPLKQNHLQRDLRRVAPEAGEDELLRAREGALGLVATLGVNPDASA